MTNPAEPIDLKQVEENFATKYREAYFTTESSDDPTQFVECIPLTQAQSQQITLIAEAAHSWYNPLLEVDVEEFSKGELLLVIEKLHEGIDLITDITTNIRNS